MSVQNTSTFCAKMSCLLQHPVTVCVISTSANKQKQLVKMFYLMLEAKFFLP